MKESMPTPLIVTVVIVVVAVLAFFGYRAINSQPGGNGQTQATLEHYSHAAKNSAAMGSGSATSVPAKTGQ